MDDVAPTIQENRRPSSPSPRTHFECSYCQRAFGRVDHLTRHIRSHLQDKPFRCEICDKAFGRQDLLKRHATCHADVEPGSKRQKRQLRPAPRVSQACKSCATAKLKCDEDPSCKRCVTKGIACEREMRNIDVVERISTTPSAELSNTNQTQSLNPFEQQHPHLPFLDHDFSNFLKGVMTPPEGAAGRPLDQGYWTGVDPAFDSLQTHGLLDFRADMDTRFDDVAMDLWDLPHSPSFYYNGIMLEPKALAVLNSKQQPATDGETVALGRAAYKASALGVWEPSQRDHINSNIKALSVLGESPHETIDLASLEDNLVPKYSTISTSLRDQMLLLTLNTCKPENKLAVIRAFPTPEILSKLIESFFAHHRVQPDSFIHDSSFDPNQQGSELLLTIVNMGTTFADSKVLHSLGFALHEVARLSLPNIFEQANSLTRALWALQTFALDIEMGLWSGIKRKMEIAESQRQMPFTMLRRSGRFAKNAKPATPPLPEDTGAMLHGKWLAWIEQESFNRLVYHSFVMDTQLSIAMTTTPLISFSELRVPMPQSKDLWLAADAEAWKTRYLRKEQQDSRLSLVDYLRDAAELDSSYDTHFCQLIILCGIWGMVWQCLQTSAILAKPKHSDAALTLRYQEILQTLHRFRINMPEEEDLSQNESSVMLYELIHMHLHISFEEVELFAGKGDQNDARRALPSLLDWASREESRKAIWHSGQVLRAAERFGPARLRGFYTVALYQANLAMWVYAVVSHVKGTDTGDKTSTARSLESVVLNGPDAPAVQRFISRGQPSAAAIQPSAVDSQVPTVTRLLDQEAVVDHVLGILTANFLHCEATPPLVENLYQLLDNLGRAATKIRV